MAASSVELQTALVVEQQYIKMASRLRILEQEYGEMERRVQVLRESAVKRREQIAHLKKTSELNTAMKTELAVLEAKDDQIEEEQRHQDAKKAEIESIKKALEPITHFLAENELLLAQAEIPSGTTLQTVTKQLVTLKKALSKTMTGNRTQDQGIVLSSVRVQSVITNMRVKQQREGVTETVKLTHDAATACNTVRGTICVLMEVITAKEPINGTLIAAIQKACNECNALFTDGSPFQLPSPRPLARELRFTMTTSGTAISDGCGNVRPVHRKKEEEEESATVTVSYHKGSSMGSSK